MRIYQFRTPEEYNDHTHARLPFSAVWAGFKGNASAHGIPHVSTSRGPVKVCFWLLVSLACLSTLSYNGYYLFLSFFNYPVNVLVKIQSERQLHFPAISVCNFNPIRRDRLRELPSMVAVVAALPAAYDELRGRGRREVRGQGGTAGRPNTTNQEDAQRDPISQQSESENTEAPNTQGSSDQPGDNTLITSVPDDIRLSIREALQRVMSDQEMSVRQSLGHQLLDFVIHCKFAGVDCNITGDFYTIYNTNYGNCFTYNWGVHEPPRYSARPGPVHGLHLVLNIDQAMYISFGTTAGVRVVIHPQGVMPFPEDQGISARTGEVAYIGLRKLVLSRLGGKYGDCVDTGQASMANNIFAEEYGAIYSNKACERTCYQRYLIEECACADTQYPRYGLAFNYTVVPGCDSTITSQDACKKRITDMYAKDELRCNCPNSCDDSDFTTTISTVEWPQEQYLDVVRAMVGNVGRYSQRASELYYRFYDYYAKNLLKLVIYYEEFNYEYIGETPAYEPSNFVGDLGGILGLYLGVTIMTILEFVELFLDFIALAIFKCCGSKEKKTCPAPEPSHTTVEPWAPGSLQTKVEPWTQETIQ